VKDRWSNRLYNLREAELQQLVTDTKPDYLLIDSSQSTDLVALYPYLKAKKIRTGIFYAMLSTICEPDIPPLNSVALPGNTSAIKKSHRLFYFQQLKRSILERIKYFGKSNNTIVSKQVLKNQFPEKYLANKPALFSLGFRNIDQFILAPKEFEFQSVFRSRHQHYVGFMVDVQRSEKGDESFEHKFADVQQKITDGKHLVYCSFGTVQYDDLKKIKSFLKKLLEIVNDSNDILIVAGIAADILKDFSHLPDNVLIFKSVPQFKVLSQASIFITHGGHNSIKESIYAGVPMLAYPIDPRTDQNGSAARIFYHSLGLRGDLSNDSSENIAKKIRTLITDHIYRKNIEQLNKLNALYTEENFLNLFKKIQTLE
jgi:hypothetical protein